MTDPFVTYEQAEMLKAAGYPQKGSDKWHEWVWSTLYEIPTLIIRGSSEACQSDPMAPTYLHAFEFLAENKGWDFHIVINAEGSTFCQVAIHGDMPEVLEASIIPDLLTAVLKKETER